MLKTNHVPEWNADVSLLGYGAMRLPTVKDEDGKEKINRAEAIEQIRCAIDGGVNYVDTAYGYHGGESEIVTGLALKDGYRDRVHLATKCPSWLVNEEADMYRLLDEQLAKLGVETIDFYLLHALNKGHFEKYRKFNYQKFFETAKKQGKIKRACFSFHDDYAAFSDIIADYDWSMAQVQFNYLDDKNQAGLQGIKDAGKKGIGIVVMEPVRGGALANPPAEILSLMESQPVKRSPVEWAFSYVTAFPEVKVVLSGMSNMEQVRQNLATFEKLPAYNESELAFFTELKETYAKRVKIGCTGCNYCQPCPMGVVIPQVFRTYDEAYRVGNIPSCAWHYNAMKEKGTFADKCVACGKCESACPQGIKIIDNLAEIAGQFAS
ncbi:MAG: aldo/keto reductase [Oscillospiraceae bacterium]|jgi:predicted aldo/keto reductase-like oxidoreductase|nr:aldo/keto reductase [Oscillospiraceae bacterium]